MKCIINTNFNEPCAARERTKEKGKILLQTVYTASSALMVVPSVVLPTHPLSYLKFIPDLLSRPHHYTPLASIGTQRTTLSVVVLWRNLAYKFDREEAEKKRKKKKSREAIEMIRYIWSWVMRRYTISTSLIFGKVDGDPIRGYFFFYKKEQKKESCLTQEDYYSCFFFFFFFFFFLLCPLHFLSLSLSLWVFLIRIVVERERERERERRRLVVLSSYLIPTFSKFSNLQIKLVILIRPPMGYDTSPLSLQLYNLYSKYWLIKY